MKHVTSSRGGSFWRKSIQARNGPTDSSGFSSFHYLKHFPIDYIKIEGEFVSNMLQDERDLALVRSVD